MDFTNATWVYEVLSNVVDPANTDPQIHDVVVKFSCINYANRGAAFEYITAPALRIARIDELDNQLLRMMEDFQTKEKIEVSKDKLATLSAGPYVPQVGSVLMLVLIGLCLVLAGVLIFNHAYKVTASRRVKCKDFQTYDQAKSAYDAGAKYLDGGKKDGIPCNDLYKKANH